MINEKRRREVSVLDEPLSIPLEFSYTKIILIRWN